ncbi:MAG: acyl-CoA thioesterase-1 [Paracoccaceae bacterium]|jgi:acyl-CoA thioesterase-1
MNFFLGFSLFQYGVGTKIDKRMMQRFGRYIFAVFLALLPVNAATAQPVTIAAFGDSLTQGYGLPVEDGLVPQLQRWLDAKGAEVTILNAGVSGDTTAGGLARIDWTLTPEIDAVIVALGGNDMLRGIDPANARQNLAGILRATRAKGRPVLLVGLDAPSNFGLDYKTTFDAIYPELALEYDALLHASYLGALEEGRSRAEVLQTLMQSDAIHPNADGVAIIVQSLGPKVLLLIDEID